jgi:hypothetical protein
MTDYKFEYSKYLDNPGAKKHPYVKPSPWITIKSIVYTFVTIIILLCGLLLLPLGLLLLAVFVLYGVFKVIFTVRHHKD